MQGCLNAAGPTKRHQPVFDLAFFFGVLRAALAILRVVDFLRVEVLRAGLRAGRASSLRGLSFALEVCGDAAGAAAADREAREASAALGSDEGHPMLRLKQATADRIRAGGAPRPADSA